MRNQEIIQALKIPKQQQAIQTKFHALIKNYKLELFPPNQMQNIASCKWVFHVKHNLNDSVSRYKARIITKSFHQWPDIDYLNTFSLIIKLAAISVVLHVALSHNWSICQLDVNNVFLHGKLDEEVFECLNLLTLHIPTIQAMFVN